VSDVVRQLVYFRPQRPGLDPDRVVVFDRATSVDTRFEKRWLFHTSGEPIVNGTGQARVPVRNGDGTGKWTYAGATVVSSTNTVDGSNGRTFLTPLLPAGRTIVKVGGPNAAGQPWQMDSHEFESPFGIITPRYGVPTPEQEQYIGRYRVEIIPSVSALSDVFLNVVEVTDAGTNTPTAAVLLPSSGLAAARVGDRIAAFNRLSTNVTTGEITLDVGGTYGIHFADLTPGGEYEVTVAGTASLKTASTAGTLYLRETLNAGARIALRATGNVVQLPPAPANVRLVAQ
jgi:hypothetical protein